ncbi:MAG: right-handed parallel beta-helix repeat-containing protein, partial [Candidatus Krumholzibacteriia bacterium]
SGGWAATIFVGSSPGVTIERNIFCRDKSGYALWDEYSFCTHTCNIYWNNAAGNVIGSTPMGPTEFVADPLFCDPVFFDLAIAFESPAASGNNACGVLIGARAAACNYVPPEECVAVRLKVRQDGSGDFTTIGAAYAAASNCDTIDVGPGTYPELLAVKKGVTFIGSSGPEVTIVDGENAHQCFVFTLGSTGASIDGFTLTRAYFPNNGAAIRVQDGVHVAVRNCRFIDNVSTANGAGFFVRHSGSRLTVEDCVFSGNHSVLGGTGTIIEPGILDLTRCVFHDNTTEVQGACVTVLNAMANIAECVMYNNASLDISGGVYFYYAGGFVRNCTFAGNTSSGYEAATVFVNGSPKVVIEKNIIASEQDGYGLWDSYDYYSLLAHTCNLFWENELGDVNGIEPDPTEIFLDPLFCDAGAANYAISFGSPAAPANNNCSTLIGACEPACHEEIATLLRTDLPPSAARVRSH